MVSILDINKNMYKILKIFLSGYILRVLKYFKERNNEKKGTFVCHGFYNFL